MASVALHCRKAHQRNGFWEHPKSGQVLSPVGMEDLFLLYAEDDAGEEMFLMQIYRTGLEQLRDNATKALISEPVVIRRA